MEVIVLRETSVILRRFDKRNPGNLIFPFKTISVLWKWAQHFNCNVWSSKGLTEGAIVHCSSQELWDCNSNHLLSDLGQGLVLTLPRHQGVLVLIYPLISQHHLRTLQ